MLTIKQENFCLSYIESGNATEAYRKSYNTKADDATVNVSAKRLLDNPKISLRIAELRKPVVEAAQITLADHLQELKELRDAAAIEGKYSAAIAAEISRGKASGLYVEKVDLTGAQGMPVITIVRDGSSKAN